MHMCKIEGDRQRDRQTTETNRKGDRVREVTETETVRIRVQKKCVRNNITAYTEPSTYS